MKYQRKNNRIKKRQNYNRSRISLIKGRRKNCNNNSKKPFKLISQQLKIQKNRGLKIDFSNDEKRLLFGNYYVVINGYKSPFLKDDRLIEEYEEGTTFDDIYNLYLFDRNLRSLYLHFLLIFEEELKSVFAYMFSKEYPEPSSYLKPSSYTNVEGKEKDVYREIDNLHQTILKQSQKIREQRNYVRHYYIKYNHVPLWVLINSLTIGDISHLFAVLEESLKNEITYRFSKRFIEEYDKDSIVKVNNGIQVGEFINIIKIVNLFRNVCAHNEVLFQYQLDKEISPNVIKYFLLVTESEFNGKDLFSLTCVLKLVLTRSDFQKFKDELIKCLRIYQDKSGEELFVKILKEMGFPSEWEVKL